MDSLAVKNKWQIFSEDKTPRAPYEGPKQRTVMQRSKQHPDVPKGDSLEDVTKGLSGSYRGRRFVARSFTKEVDTGGQVLVKGAGSVHLYVDTPVPHMAVGANYEKLGDVEGSDAVKLFGPEFAGWLQKNWARFGVLRGGDGVIGMEVRGMTKKKLFNALDFLSEVADHLPVER